MSGHQRTNDEVAAALKEQRGFLRRSCEAYDAGELSEAKRMATSIYVICHDGGRNSRSLLSQLGVKNQLKFVSTAKQLDSGVIPRTALAGPMFLGGGMIFAPWFLCTRDTSQVREEVPFEKWWEQTVFETVKVGRRNQPAYVVDRSLSRKNIIFSMRSQDNGSHFDPRLTDDAYVAMTKWQTGMEYSVGDEEVYRAIPSPHLATVRQIAWELEQTLIHVAGGPALPSPEAAVEWVKNPPKQFVLGSTREPVKLRVRPEFVPEGYPQPVFPMMPSASEPGEIGTDTNQ